MNTESPFIVARHWEKTGHLVDYLRSWDDQYGAIFSGFKVAMAFDTMDAAIYAARRAKRAVPKCMTGANFIYTVVKQKPHPTAAQTTV